MAKQHKRVCSNIQDCHLPPRYCSEAITISSFVYMLPKILYAYACHLIIFLEVFSLRAHINLPHSFNSGQSRYCVDAPFI